MAMRRLNLAPSLIFIPIVTPTAIASSYCRFEFESFLAREEELGRRDLIFPILYIRVTELADSAKRDSDSVLSIIAQRQYVDWRDLRHRDIQSPQVAQEIERLGTKITEALHRPEGHEVKKTDQEDHASTLRQQTEELRRQRQQTQSQLRIESRNYKQEQFAGSNSAALPRSRAHSIVNPTDQRFVSRWRQMLVGGIACLVTVALILGWEIGGTWSPIKWSRLLPVWISWNPRPMPNVGQSFSDCSRCPQMTVVPAGEFTMGADASEEGSKDVERPRRLVAIKKPFAVGNHDVTRAEYRTFIDATDRPVDNDCYNEKLGEKGKSWRDPGFIQTDNDPVVCVSWTDAKAYALWLSQNTGKLYRLLSEAEWEYAARAGTSTARYWGEEAGSGNANCAGCGSPWDNQSTSPVGSFAPNAFGLHDMLGNAWQWVEDCFNKEYTGAPIDGSAWTSGECGGRMMRGGAWNYFPRVIRASTRYHAYFGDRYAIVGFRVGRAE
jgi:formylglycine-generating enzyme required for sulfatase activity